MNSTNNSKSSLRILGDIHGRPDRPDRRQSYLDLIEGADYTLQVGDLDSHDYDWLTEAGVDPHHHKFITGNHEAFSKAKVSRHYLGDYGDWFVTGIGGVFFVRGAWSINHASAKPDIDWFPDEEEMGISTCYRALECYERIKPTLLVSHTCPTRIISLLDLGDRAAKWGYEPGRVIHSKTGGLLDNMLDIHKPEVHIFGHWHVEFDQVVDGTRFICLPPHKAFNVARA